MSTINPLHTSPAYREHARASMSMDRPTRVRDAVTEAVVTVNPARVDRCEAYTKYAPVIDEITRAILAGDKIIPATRDAFRHHLDLASKKVTPVAWRILFDLEGGPGWWQ